ncbi:replication protein A 70 kDa DNA-binding subunit C-like [Cryptomeria japonica]|uniref:replication protein A 70 kDa DNA-binding subunit C-like n=1 Tax=Cryptomeria japonica TaxID=3369 RepID=UPI0027DA1F18|nr:replication protein A 70 kDa DNA-binding subunit C-like [Cryptomeria japonica]
MASASQSAEPTQQVSAETTDMDPEIQLTPHAIVSINAGDDVPSPILQLLSFEKLIDNKDDNAWYRLVLSDGTHMQLSILPPKYSELLLSDTLKIGYVLSLIAYACRTVWNLRFIIIFKLVVKFTNSPLLGKPRYFLKEKEQEMFARDPALAARCSLKFGIHVPPAQQETFHNISLIKALIPFQNKWAIKGRVINKRKMHQYNTPKSSGQVFNFDMIDAEGTEIRIMCFGDIAKMHYHSVEPEAYYYLSKGSIKEANTKWNKVNSHLEITLDQKSILKRCDPPVDGEGNASQFTPINELTNCSNNTLVDVIGVVIDVKDLAVISRKDGTKVKKMVVKINDMSTFIVDVNLWGVAWEQLGEDLKNMHVAQTIVVLQVTNARVGYFNEKIILQDHTGSLWGTAFDEVGTNLLGMSAKELYMLQYDLAANRTPQSIIKNVLLSTFVFTLSVTTENYNS